METFSHMHARGSWIDLLLYLKPLDTVELAWC